MIPYTTCKVVAAFHDKYSVACILSKEGLLVSRRFYNDNPGPENMPLVHKMVHWINVERSLLVKEGVLSEEAEVVHNDLSECESGIMNAIMHNHDGESLEEHETIPWN